MAHAFNDEEKEVQEFNGNYFGFGVHKVQLLLAETGQTEAGKEFIEISFCDPENGDKTDSARVWFVGGASNISFNTLRSIVVHNAPEDKKTVAGEAVDKVADSEELCALINEKCMGGELWFTKYYDPSRTYTSERDNQVHKSINKNIYGYEPALKPELMPQEQKNISANDFEEDDINKIVPGGTPASAADKAQIPDNWS